ncbi:GntR family transcriptional regulator [Streptomyces sp. NBC_01538]|uniref:GntR family transcriptional regulator n=1 Tax=Streptomyces sp. NBC_01538 TaxID=2903897 RepID=UPI00386FC40C
MPDVRDHKDTRDDIARVARALRTRLADGTYPPGRWLPSGPTLAAELGVTTYAVQIAIKRLIAEKSIKSARSKGFYVPDPADPAAVPPGRAANGTAAAPGKRSTRFSDDAARVERAVRARLADGTYPAGTWVPSPRSLTSEFGVTADAVRTAMRRLAADRLIKSVAGVGMYVSDPAAPGAVPARPGAPALRRRLGAVAAERGGGVHLLPDQARRGVG